ncbi:unnamed protein product [Durusdinium trenchii]|uniref:Uncharacterized protein n=1 Tax=Durusdinium trenchii TaxID=1381693 RepID=A0ABP0RBN8_9DINO
MPTFVPKLSGQLHQSSLRITRSSHRSPSEKYQVGASAVVAALDLLYGEHLLRHQLTRAFDRYRGMAALAALRCFRGGRSSSLEMLPGFGGPLDAEAMSQLDLLRLDAPWLSQARYLARRAGPLVAGAKPAAKGLTSWTAEPSLSRGRTQGYQRGSPDTELLHAVLAEHDRSTHAERQALVKVLQQLVGKESKVLGSKVTSQAGGCDPSIHTYNHIYIQLYVYIQVRCIDVAG